MFHRTTQLKNKIIVPHRAFLVPKSILNFQIDIEFMKLKIQKFECQCQKKKNYFLCSLFLMVTIKFTIFMNYVLSKWAIISGNQRKLSNVANPIITVSDSNYQPAIILRLSKKTISQYLPSNHPPLYHERNQILGEKYCIFSCLYDVITSPFIIQKVLHLYIVRIVKIYNQL